MKEVLLVVKGKLMAPRKAGQAPSAGKGGKMRGYIRMRRVRVSYIQAPDHGRAELAVVLPPEMGGKVVPVAYGERATALWRTGKRSS